MILFLRLLFLFILASMLGVTTWASLQCPLFGVPREVFTHPWFLATLADAYWGFITFFVWVCYQWPDWIARLGWFIAIMLLGNIAMALYCLALLFRAPGDAAPASLLTQRHAGRSGFGWLLAVIGAVVVALA
jgi:hypothetical protein